MSSRLCATVGLVAVLGLVGGACSSNKTASPPATSSSTAAGESTVHATAQLSFDPVTLNVKKGDTVTWNNSSGIPHTVTFENGPAFDQSLNDGAQVTRSFTTAGTFNYYCKVHGKSMHGTIVVS